MVQLQRIKPDWKCPVIVVATGPSLDRNVAWVCRRARWFDGWRIVGVNDAYKMIPCADALYACDERWWEAHNGVPTFLGEKWTTHEGDTGHTNDKSGMPKEWNVNFVEGRDGNTFSKEASKIHYGSNSGFQAVNLALLKGATNIVLVGFDMRVVDGRRHFFGDHPEPMHNRADYKDFIAPFRHAARECAVPIVNCTPGSALDCFPMGVLEQELRRCAA